MSEDDEDEYEHVRAVVAMAKYSAPVPTKPSITVNVRQFEYQICLLTICYLTQANSS